MSVLSHDIFIIDAIRTPIGRAFRSLKEFTPQQLAALCVEPMLQRADIDPPKITDVILGNTVAAGLGQNMARQAAWLAHLADTTRAYTVNHVCGSGLQAVVLAAQALWLRSSGLVIAGGAESASQSPELMFKNQHGREPVDSLIHDGLTCQITGKHMGQLADETAKKFQITRQQQDEYALRSHQKAVAAQDKGVFAHEITPVTTDRGKIIEKDERPRRHLTMEMLTELPPAFGPQGTVTAGNAPAPADGAALVLMGNADQAKQLPRGPRARLAGFSLYAGPARDVFKAAVPSLKACLEDCGWSLNQVDLLEITEAFAVQSVYTRRQLDIPDEKMNIFGGDIALGHPLGASGARALVTLLNALEQTGGCRGIVSVCLGGGGAIALAVERC